MAARWQIRGLVKCSSFGFYVLVMIILSIQYNSASPHLSSESSLGTLSRYGDRVKRSPYENEEQYEEDQLPDSSEIRSREDQENGDDESLSEEDVDVAASSLISKEEKIEEEEIKPKNSNKQQKPIPNFAKNFSISKTGSNESFNEKQKQGLKYNGFKKDKFVPGASNQSQNVSVSNSTVINSHNVENKASKFSVDLSVTNLTRTILPNIARTNETHIMNDQPIVANDTELSDEEDLLDSLLPITNSTDTFDDANITTSADGRTMPASEGLDFFLISGIILGTITFLGLVGAGAFVVYRQRMWNKPQTLSDKCSNADSSGYIDDSTLRENSEEMYSLDNDSFLNSLEAMTIQNYWTDNVKHTKL